MLYAIVSKDVIRLVEEYAVKYSDEIAGGAWIEGLGWDQTKWAVNEFPSAVSALWWRLAIVADLYRVHDIILLKADLNASPILSGLLIGLKRVHVSFPSI